MNNKLKPYLLAVPQIVLAMIFLVSLITGITQSLGVIPAFGLTEPTLKYYKEIFEKKDLLSSVLFSLYLAFISAFFSTVIGTWLCMILVMGRYTQGKVIRCIQIPIIVPHVVVAIFTVNILSQSGMLARICYVLGLVQDQKDVLPLIYDAHGIGIILAYLWKETPFIIYFVIALMANIDGRLGEAAVNLGAGRWRSFLYITLPLCMRSIASGFLIIFVFALGAYELPQLLGPTLPKALPILAYLEYIHPDLHNRPYAMAMNGIIIIISLICAVIYFLLMTRNTGKIRKREGGQ